MAGRLIDLDRFRVDLLNEKPFAAVFDRPAYFGLVLVSDYAASGLIKLTLKG